MEKSLFMVNKGSNERESSQELNSSMIKVYERHVDTIYRVCFSLFGNKQDAEDATQTVFIKLMESNKAFVDEEHEKAWLIVTAKNYCIDLHRKWWRKKVVEMDSKAIGDLSKESLPHYYLEENLRNLPPTYRLLLYLYYYEGYKLADISAMLRINLNTVKTKMRNAKKRLKLEIGDDFRE